MEKRFFTVPNQITLLRFCFIPFFIILVYYDRYAWALGLLVAAALSDALDGVLARVLEQKTALGAYLDPIADKLLLSSSFFILALKQRMDWWLAILVLSRDVLILAVAAAVLVVSGYRPLPPTIYGKLTTASQVLLVVVIIADEATGRLLPEPARDVGALLVAALTIFSGLHYSFTIARRLSA